MLATRADDAVAPPWRRPACRTRSTPLRACWSSRGPSRREGVGLVVVAAAGTADLPVAEEAALVAEALGNRVERVTDCGVAGLHRLLAHRDLLARGQRDRRRRRHGGRAAQRHRRASSDRPVIAVPTSVGYGASLDGLAALLTMLNSCAPGVSVVNIDNGYGAAHQAVPDQPSRRQNSIGAPPMSVA